jgi:gamma-glutamyl:cysteine ligase YbdK (ATP-grasp superfamily)
LAYEGGFLFKPHGRKYLNNQQNLKGKSMKTDTVFSNFMKKFKFDPTKKLFVGCEREFFITDHNNEIKPLSKKVLDFLNDNRFGYELSACQTEAHIGPVKINYFEKESFSLHSELIEKLSLIGLKPLFQTVGPEDMSIEVFPDPTGRYQRITANMPKETLLAACRVTGTHFHIGMSNHHTALRVYNHTVLYFDDLCRIGDLTNGERHRIYQTMAKDSIPRSYNSWEDLLNFYLENGYSDDPRKCWHFIRISTNGTIEFRMFDNTSDLNILNFWARTCHDICSDVI